MSADSPPDLIRIAFGDLEHEIANTRRMVEALPADQLGWRPHEKSLTMGGLALHVANLLSWALSVLHEEDFDFSTAPPPRSEPESREDILAELDANAARLQEALGELRPGALFETWTLRNGEHVIFAMPRIAVVRGMIINHVIHHRAQLAVYLRLLDAPVPGLYGPSADKAA